MGTLHYLKWGGTLLCDDTEDPWSPFIIAVHDRGIICFLNSGPSALHVLFTL